MGHVMYCYTGCILYIVSHTDETLSDFLLNYGFREMGHDGVTSGYPIPTSFHILTGCQRNPWDKGVTFFIKVHFNWPFNPHIAFTMLKLI